MVLEAHLFPVEKITSGDYHSHQSLDRGRSWLSVVKVAEFQNLSGTKRCLRVSLLYVVTNSASKTG